MLGKSCVSSRHLHPGGQRWCSCCSPRRWWWGRASSGPAAACPWSGSSRGSSGAGRCCSLLAAAGVSPSLGSEAHGAHTNQSGTGPCFIKEDFTKPGSCGIAKKNLHQCVGTFMEYIYMYSLGTVWFSGTLYQNASANIISALVCFWIFEF